MVKIAVCVSASLCGGCEPSRQETSPADRPAEGIGQLRLRFDDVKLQEPERLAAARALLATDAAFLAGRYAIEPGLLWRLVNEGVEARDTTYLPLIATLFETVEGEARIDFEVALLAFGSHAQPRLVALLETTDRALVLRSVDALARLQRLDSTPHIAGLLEHRDPWIRMGAAHALGDLGGARAERALATALRDSVYSVVNAALAGLARMASPAALEPALALAASDNAEVRKHAANALGAVGEGRARQVLEGLAAADPDAGVRFMADRALRQLAGRH
jgi:hypothetical protein